MKLRKDQMLCPHCQKAMNKHYSYCPTCGEYVHNGEAQMSIFPLIIKFMCWLGIMLIVVFALAYMRVSQ